MFSAKIISIHEFQELRREMQEKGLKIIHCHGVFDLLHPGHISHLQQARSLGDILVVSVTTAEYVFKGPGRPYFSDELRMKSIASLSCVDYVILSEAETALEVLDGIRPDIYVKGSEYEETKNDITLNIQREIELVRSYGGEVSFTTGLTFSSTRLLNNEFPVLCDDARLFLKDFAASYSLAEIRSYVEDFRNIRILVLGDIIIDQYVFCSVQGLSSKDRALSALYEREEEYPGGALAIARHLASFSPQVKFFGMIGNEPAVHVILDALKDRITMDLHYESGFKTVVKRRYLERRGIRNDYDKLFSINYINEPGSIKREGHKAFYRELKKTLPDFDLVVLSDFGHGLIDAEFQEVVQEKASFLALNCQTNTANFGNNPIGKYQRADTFTLDERELKLAFSSSTASIDDHLKCLARQLGAGMGWLTLGSRGAVGCQNDTDLLRIPAMTLKVEDTIGAGDAFFALGSLCARAGLPLEVATFLASVAGALAANILGNSEAVDRVKLLKYASTLLNC